ncbi:hypothetical protein PS2_018928 [Malus domestica]
MNIKPLRYSIVLDCHPDSLPHVSTAVAKRSLRLRDAILSSYHHNEVKFSELTLDTFRMLQCLEWEPSGSFYQSSGAKNGQNGAPASSRINYSQDIADPTLPPNPRKAVLYRPSVTRFRAVLATVCEELPPDGVILIYLSASGAGMYSDVTSPSTLAYSSNRINPSRGQGKGDGSSSQVGCLQFGSHRNRGVNNIYPSDLGPFTRRPLVLVIDCDNSEAFEAINGVQKGETVAMLLSSSSSYHATLGSSRQSSGSLFTIFLTAPVQAFCLLLGISHSLTLTTVRGAFSGRTAVPSTCSSPHATGRPNAIIDSTPVAALRQTPAHLLLLRRENNSRSSSTPCGNLLPPLQLHRRPMSRCSRACPHPYPPHLRSETNARNLFNQMPHKDLVTWTALISGYSQHDRPQDALVLFPEMLRHGLEPNQFTLSSLLKASGAVSDNNHGRQLHTYCFKYGLDSKCLCGHCSCGHVC